MAQGSGLIDPVYSSDVPPARSPHRIRRPLVGVAVFFVLGLLAGRRWDIPVLQVSLLGVLLSLLTLRFARVRFMSAGLWLAVALAGAVHIRLAMGGVSARELKAVMRCEREHVSLVGVVASEPVMAPAREVGWEIRKFEVRVEGMRRAEDWQRVRGTIDVWWLAAADERAVSYGDRWLLSGVAGGEDGVGRGRANLSMRVEGDSACRLSQGHGSRFVSLCMTARQRGLHILERGIEDYPDSVAMLEALLLGYRQDMSPRLYQAFSTTGTLHIIAVSGLHVGVVVLMVIALLKMLGWSRPRWIFFLAPAVVTYTVVTGASPSAVRACVMALVIWGASALQRRPDGLSSLAAAALLILGFAPEQVREPGFIFSFTAVAGLMTLYAPMVRPFLGRVAADPWRVQAERWPARWGRRVVVYVGSLAIASFAAWVATAPLTAHYFNLVSPVSWLANLAVIPLSFVILFSGAVSLVVGGILPLAAEVMNHASRVFIDMMLASVDLAGRVPGGYRFVRAPSPEELVAWYVLLVLLLSARGWTRRVMVFGTAGVLGFILVTGWMDRAATLHVIDVGHGNAVFVNMPGGRDILVDAGPRRAGRRVVRYLRGQGVDRLAALVLTHGDADHSGGAVEVLRAVPVDEVWCPPFLSRSSVTREALREARAQGIRVRRLACGDRGSLGSRAEWEVLNPSGGEPGRNADESSLVMRVGAGAASVILMGGGNMAAESAVLLRPRDVMADVLVVGNHAARDTCGFEWLDAVSPVCAVVSVGRNNLDGHPDRAPLGRLKERGVEVHRTDEEGDLVIELGSAREGATRLPRVRSAVSGTPDRS